MTNLLSYLGSCVVTDPKGELFGLTAGHRRRKLGHRVVRLDPFSLGGPGADTFNPLDLIEADSPTCSTSAETWPTCSSSAPARSTSRTGTTRPN